MAVLVSGLIGIGVFYLITLAIGLWAGRKAKDDSEEEMFLAGRTLGSWLGIMTLTATWVSGTYLSGTAEIMFKDGLLWVQVPIGYSMSLFIGNFLAGLFFVKPMRDLKCVTLLDPFQRKYGSKIGALLLLPCIIGDFFWVGSLLNALGASLAAVTDLNPKISILLSAAVIAIYTSFGAMYSVTYTDVAQLVMIITGLVLSLGFAVGHPDVDFSEIQTTDWVGSISSKDLVAWIDVMLLLILGGIPWQGYFQRILAISSTKAAQKLSMISMFTCMLMAVPSAFLGVLARCTDWENVPTFNRSIRSEDANIILPLVLRHLTPEWVNFIGLGAISAVTMSSTDSVVLGFAAIFSKNIYKALLRTKASKREMVWIRRGSILIIAAAGATVAITMSSITYIVIVGGDLVYVILFPQLLLVLYWTKHVNSYGCVTSFFIGLILRLLGGEPGLGLPVILKYPGFENGIQHFPLRTFTMLIVLFSHMFISWFTNYLYKIGFFPPEMDILKAFATREVPTEGRKVLENCLVEGSYVLRVIPKEER